MSDVRPTADGHRPLRRAFLAFAAMIALAWATSACTPSYPDCDDDTHCRSHGEVCVDKRCHQCRDDSQCTKTDACMMCQANECVKRPNCCKSALDCPGGRCVDGTCGPQCEDDSHCAAGQRCLDGSCIQRTGCSDDSHCADGLRCQDGGCVPTECELKPIYFDFNEYAVRLDQEPLLNANAACLKQSARAVVKVEGHCDERGSDEYNLTLGQRRANSVARTYRALGVKGIGPTLSWGEEKPVCSGSNERCWRQNRRVETLVE